MKMIKKSLTLDGVVLIDTGKKLLGHNVYEAEDGDYGLTLIIADHKMQVKAEINVLAECSQNTAIISGLSIK